MMIKLYLKIGCSHVIVYVLNIVQITLDGYGLRKTCCVLRRYGNVFILTSSKKASVPFVGWYSECHNCILPLLTWWYNTKWPQSKLSSNSIFKANSSLSDTNSVKAVPDINRGKNEGGIAIEVLGRLLTS